MNFLPFVVTLFLVMMMFFLYHPHKASISKINQGDHQARFPFLNLTCNQKCPLIASLQKQNSTLFISNYTEIDRNSVKYKHIRWKLPPYSKIPKSRDRPLTAMNFISKFHKAKGYWPNENENIKRATALVDSFFSKLRELGVHIKSNKNETNKLPEIYHYIWLKCHDFTIVNQLSMISLARIILENKKSLHRSQVIFHTDCPPKDSIFSRIIKSFPNFKIQKLPDYRMLTKITRETISKKILKIEHVSDVYRLMILHKLGGIYLDSDILMLKSHNNFIENYQDKVVLGEQSKTDIANGFIISGSENKLISKWLLEMTYFDGTWRFSTYLAKFLWRTFPDEIHVERATMIRPRIQEGMVIYNGYFDWQQNYNVHIYKKSLEMRLDKKLKYFGDFDCMDNSFGEIARWILYRNYDPC